VRALGFADNQSTLLKAAKAPSKEAQIRALREKAAKKAAGRDAANASEARIEAAKSAVKRLSQDELVAFGRWFADFRVQHVAPAPATWTMRI
jgi:DNA-binding MarR family transcriptional regulator